MGPWPNASSNTLLQGKNRSNNRLVHIQERINFGLLTGLYKPVIVKKPYWLEGSFNINSFYNVILLCSLLMEWKMVLPHTGGN